MLENEKYKFSFQNLPKHKLFLSHNFKQLKAPKGYNLNWCQISKKGKLFINLVLYFKV